MTARLQPATPPYSDAIQNQLEKIMPPGVPPLVLFTTLARDQRLFSRFMGAGLLDKGHLTLRQREIVIDRTTALCGSEYEWGVHAAFFAERAELNEEQLYSIVYGNAGDACWSAEDSILLRLCDSLHRTSTIDDFLWEDLISAFSEEAILELILLAGFYHTVSFLTNGLQIPLEQFAMRFPAKSVS